MAVTLAANPGDFCIFEVHCTSFGRSFIMASNGLQLRPTFISTLRRNECEVAKQQCGCDPELVEKVDILMEFMKETKEILSGP